MWSLEIIPTVESRRKMFLKGSLESRQLRGRLLDGSFMAVIEGLHSLKELGVED